MFAAECAHAGVSIDDTIAAVNELVPQTCTFGMLSDLRYAVRGGRVPSWVGTVASALNMTPFIRATPEGRIAASGFAFGKRNTVAKFARSLIRNARSKGPLNIAVGHSAFPDGARKLEQLLRRDLPQIERLTSAELGSALGVHVGPGALIVAMQPATKPPR